MVKGEQSFDEQHFDDTSSAEIDSFSSAQELSGKPGRNPDKEGLPHTVTPGGESELGSFVLDAIGMDSSVFTPDSVMERLVKDYRSASEIFGDSLLRRITGYSSEYIEKNLRIPEFVRHLEEKVSQGIKGLQEEGVLDAKGELSEEAYESASVVLLAELLDEFVAKGQLGAHQQKKKRLQGVDKDVQRFSNQAYKDISVRKSVQIAVRRGHKQFHIDDLRITQEEGVGFAEIIYAVDSSGSMKGEKLSQARRAGILLAYEAISRQDSVGLVSFGPRVSRIVPPGKDFPQLLHAFMRIRASGETDLSAGIIRATELFSSGSHTKHIVLLSDAIPTAGSNPESAVIEAASFARARGVSLSVVGIGLDAQSSVFASRLASLGGGRLLLASQPSDLSILLLEEYTHLRQL